MDKEHKNNKYKIGIIRITGKTFKIRTLGEHDKNEHWG